MLHGVSVRRCTTEQSRPYMTFCVQRTEKTISGEQSVFIKSQMKYPLNPWKDWSLRRQRQTSRQVGTDIQIDTSRQTYWQTYTHGRQTDRQAGRQTDSQTDRQAGRQTERLIYWAIQRSWFARVNALCNLSRKKSREVAAHFRADFWVGVASRCA